MTITERLIEELKKADASADRSEIEQIAWLIGSLPVDHRLRSHLHANELPRICALLPEMSPCRHEADALARIAEYMDDDGGIVSSITDMIIEAVRG